MKDECLITGGWQILREKAKLKEDCDERYVEMTEALAKSYALKANNDYIRSFIEKPN